MSVVRAENLETVEVQGNHMTGLITPSKGGASELMVWCARLDAGASSPPHIHDHEEIILVLSGQGLVRIANEEFTLNTQDACLIPANTQHQVFNTGSEPWTLITAMPVGTRFIRPDGSETPAPPWTR